MSMKFLCMLFLLTTRLFCSVSGRDDISTMKWAICNTQKLGPSDPFLGVVHALLGDIAFTTPDLNNYIYSTSSTNQQGVTAYGYGQCDTTVSEETCAVCLTDCTNAFLDICGPAIGAQIAMVRCYMRYESYRFV